MSQQPRTVEIPARAILAAIGVALAVLVGSCSFSGPESKQPIRLEAPTPEPTISLRVHAGTAPTGAPVARSTTPRTAPTATARRGS